MTDQYAADSMTLFQVLKAILKNNKTTAIIADITFLRHIIQRNPPSQRVFEIVYPIAQK